MSERMIEIRRAKMGLPPTTAAGGSSSVGGVPVPGAASLVNAGSHRNAVISARPTVQQAAAATIFAEEEQMKCFLQKMQERETSSSQLTGPTVPTALSRRILQRQGVGYLDEAVSSVASATADRFLATVLQQSIACRDQRLKGAELARKESRKRRRHVLQYKQDADERQRRKDEREEARRKENLAAIEAVNNIGKGTAANVAAPAKAKKKKKKTDTDVNDNGKTKTKDGPNANADDESSYDSLDEEEKYYEDFYGVENDDAKDNEMEEEEEDEEEDFTLRLRDLVRPLEAWGVRMTGKLGLGATPEASSDESDSDDDEEGDEDTDVDSTKKNTGEDGDKKTPAAANGPNASPTGKADNKTAESSDRSPGSKKTKAPPRTANSPVPKSSS